MPSPERDHAMPRATYRLQFNKDFGFDAAAALAPYLAGLGISHVYASPYLRARPGSTHGYDIVSHTELNPELGTAEAYARMVAAFKAHGLSQILDFVPNHMGVGGADNPWWLNVLEWGPDSEFAGWFDIDWETDRKYLRQKTAGALFGGPIMAWSCNRAALSWRSMRMRGPSPSGPMIRIDCPFHPCITGAF